jgi:hypothetical protein
MPMALEDDGGRWSLRTAGASDVTSSRYHCQAWAESQSAIATLSGSCTAASSSTRSHIWPSPPGSTATDGAWPVRLPMSSCQAGSKRSSPARRRRAQSGTPFSGPRRVRPKALKASENQ